MNSSLSSSQLDILVVLSHQKSHGYAIMKSVDELHGTSKRLGPAQLYTGLEKLMNLGYVREVKNTDPRKRIYELTSSGMQVAQEEVLRQQNFITKASSLLGMKYV